MNVLQVNKFWYPLGGVEAYLDGVVAELERRGHAVAAFGMQHPENRPTAHADLFVPFVDLRSGGRGMGPGEKLRTAGRLLYDGRAGRGVAALCRAFHPDVAHVHLFERQLTSAVIHGLARSRVPIVQTFHDYSFVCANYTLMKGTTVPCDLACTRRGYHQAVVHACVKRSRAASALGALELVLRREVFAYHRRVALFLSPSEYLRRVLVEGGLDPRRVRHVPNYVRVAEHDRGAGGGGYVLFVGRLSFEKGLWTLLEAAGALPDLEFRIVGRGPEGEALERRVREGRLSNVRLEGFKQGEELRAMYRDALCVVLPSEWPENSPMVVYEAFASARPVVATRMGGIPELVEEGLDGMLVPDRDPAALAAALRDLARSPERANDMGARGREKVERRYDLAHHVDRLEEIYAEVAHGASAAPARPARAPDVALAAR